MKYNTLTDALVLTRRADGTPVIPIEEYYLRRVYPLGTKYQVSVPRTGKGLGLCPLHEDLAPSMGIVQGRDGRERFNCFGCESYGHIVDLHRKVENRHHGRRMSNDQSARELISMWHLDLDMFLEHVLDDGELDTDVRGRELRRKRDKEAIYARYDSTMFRSDLLKALSEGKGTAYYNALLMKVTEAHGD